jgi:hypothetical protein
MCFDVVKQKKWDFLLVFLLDTVVCFFDKKHPISGTKVREKRDNFPVPVSIMGVYRTLFDNYPDTGGV